MDKVIKIEEFESDMCMGRENFEYKNTMQLIEGIDVKTELDTSTFHTEINIKNEIDTSTHTFPDRIKYENINIEEQDISESSSFLNRLVKIEKVESEMYVDRETLGYMGTIQPSVPLNEKLNIKNEIGTNMDTSHLPFDRIKNEHGIGKWNKTVSSMVDIVDKIDVDTSTLHTELDIKNDSDTSTCDIPFASVVKKEVRKKECHVVDSEADVDLFICYYCKYTVTSKNHLIEHMKVHKKKNMYSCCYCDFQTNLRKFFIAHMRTHRSNNYIYEQFNGIYKKKENVDDIVTRGNLRFTALDTSVLHNPGSIYEAKSNLAMSSRINMRCIHCTASFRTKITLDDHIIKKHPSFISSVTRKIHECTKCTFKTSISRNLKRHLLKHSETASNYKLSTCLHCNASRKSKKTLDDHIIRKHPNFISSVTCKIYTCTECTFKTTMTGYLTKHLLTHPSASVDYNFKTCIHCNTAFKDKQSLDDHTVKKHSNFIASVTSRLRTCLHCNASFKSKIALDDHIIKRHPSFISSVTRKIHECTKCDFKTTIRGHLTKHLLKHPETAANYYKSNTCIHCNTAFRDKQSLDDHTVKKHPNFMASVTSKIHECTKCTFKTTVSKYLNSHLLKHPETANNYKFSRCVHCNKIFLRKTSLDDHIIKKHPNLIAFLNCKIHKCTKCIFKTAIKSALDRHQLKHRQIAANHKYSKCVHCNKIFLRKTSLDDHMIKKHPNFIASLSCKIHECTKCTFKTAIKGDLDRHLSKHPEIATNHKFSRCTL